MKRTNIYKYEHIYMYLCIFIYTIYHFLFSETPTNLSHLCPSQEIQKKLQHPRIVELRDCFPLAPWQRTRQFTFSCVMLCRLRKIGELETVQKAGSECVASGSLANFFYGSKVSHSHCMTRSARDNNFRKTFPFQFGRC